MSAARLIDDGTMDTVVVCPECGEEQRYSYAIGGPDQVQGEEPAESYDEFVKWAMADFDGEHECPEEEAK